MRVRADDEWRVPVPALRHLAFALLRLYAKAFAGLAIKAHQITVLRFSVDRVRIFRINQRAEAVTALGYEPVLIVDAGDVFRPRGTAERIVVLRAAVNKVKRLRVIDGNVVELAGRQVRHPTPRGAGVTRGIEAAVIAYQHVFYVVRINPEHVEINMDVRNRQRLYGFAAIVGVLHDYADGVETVFTLGIGKERGVILRARVVVIALFPVHSGVNRAVDSALVFARLDARVHDVGIHRRNCQPDAPEFQGGRKSARQLGPGLAGINALVNPRFGAAVDQTKEVPPPLVTRREQHVGVRGIHHHVSHAGVFAETKD